MQWRLIVKKSLWDLDQQSRFAETDCYIRSKFRLNMGLRKRIVYEKKKSQQVNKKRLEVTALVCQCLIWKRVSINNSQGTLWTCRRAFGKLAWCQVHFNQSHSVDRFDVHTHTKTPKLSFCAEFTARLRVGSSKLTAADSVSWLLLATTSTWRSDTQGRSRRSLWMEEDGGVCR